MVIFRKKKKDGLSDDAISCSSGSTADDPGRRRGPSRADHLRSLVDHVELGHSTRRVSKDDSTYDTYFQTVAGDALVLRVYMPPACKKFVKRSSALSAPPEMQLHGVVASHTRLLDSRMQITGYVPISSAEEWAAAVAGGMDLGKAVSEVVRDFQLDPPAVEVVIDERLRCMRRAQKGLVQVEEQGSPSLERPEPPGREEHIRSLLDHEELGRSTRQVALKDDSAYDIFFRSIAGDALILRVKMPPASRKLAKQGTPTMLPHPPVMQLYGVRATHARLLDSQMQITGYAPISSAEEWAAAVAGGMDLGKAVSEVVRDLQLDPPTVEKVKDKRLRRVQEGLAQTRAERSTQSLDESTSRVSEAETDVTPNIGLPPPNAAGAWSEWREHGGENRVSTSSVEGSGGNCYDVDLSTTDNSIFREESTTSGEVEQQFLPNGQSEHSLGANESPASTANSETALEPSRDLPMPSCALYDELTVFQAAPLVWMDSGDNLHSIETLDFDRERDVLTKALREGANAIGAQLHLTFETATTDRLGAFLAARGSRALHFTCHGAPEYLCLEGENGAAQFLRVDDLREFMSAGEGGGLSFVFVSACHSRPAGEAFLRAGVPHVVCCKLEQPLMDQAAVEFSCGFYRALACGKTLQRAFELGRQAVKLSPKVPDAKNEMGKFLLLPEGADHDVAVFFVSPLRQKSIGLKRNSSLSSQWTLPNPPDLFLGRSKDVYSVLKGLSHSRLVRITGGAGLGKTSLAAAVCHYMNERQSTFPYDEIVWLPLICAPSEGSLSSHFNSLIASADCRSSAHGLHVSDESMRAILEKLSQVKTLVVVEMKCFSERNKTEFLSAFLQDLFRGNQLVRVLLVCREGTDMSLPKCCTESEISLDPLGFEATATLFGRLCPHVSQRLCPTVHTPNQLSNLLVPEGKEEATMICKSVSLSKRCIDIFKAMGGGVPSEVHRIAKNMTEKDYRKLIEIGRQKEYEVKCETRVELEIKLASLRKDLKAAVHKEKFVKAKQIRVAQDELMRYREFLPELEALKGTADALRKDLDLAASKENFDEAEQLRKQLKAVEQKIGLEKQALFIYNMASSRRDKVSSEQVTDEKRKLSMSFLLSNTSETQDSVICEGQQNDSRIRRIQGLSISSTAAVACT